jgi:hypothetical protein
VNHKHYQTMKNFFLLTALFAVLSAQSQEKLPREECMKYAFIVSANLKELLNTPIPTDPDVKRPAAVKDEGSGAMVLPETKLSAQTFARIGKETVPVGQLWMAYLAPVSEGKVIPADKLRLVHLATGDQDVDAPCLALAVRKDPKANLELLIYGKTSEPLIRLPLKSVASVQDVPVDLTAERKDDGSTLLKLTFVGKYAAALTVRPSGQ